MCFHLFPNVYLCFHLSPYVCLHLRLRLQLLLCRAQADEEILVNPHLFPLLNILPVQDRDEDLSISVHVYLRLCVFVYLLICVFLSMDFGGCLSGAQADGAINKLILNICYLLRGETRIRTRNFILLPQYILSISSFCMVGIST